MTARHTTRVAFALLCAVALVAGMASPSVATAVPSDGETTAAHAPPVLFDGLSVAVGGSDGSPGSGVVTLELAAPAVTESHRTASSSEGTFESESRREIHAVVSRRPGVHLAAVADVTDRPASTVRYHVRVLERDGHLETRRLDGKRRLFTAAVDSDRYELHAALSDPPTAELLAALARSEPVGVTELAERTDRSPSTVSHHLDRLVDASVLEYERDGRSVRVRTSEAVSEVLETRTESAGRTD